MENVKHLVKVHLKHHQELQINLAKDVDNMIHQYKLNGYNIVLDVYSGAIHVVDEVAYDIIELYENHSKEEIIEIIVIDIKIL